MALFTVWVDVSMTVEVPDENAVEGADPNEALRAAVAEELRLSAVDVWSITEWAVS